MRHAGTVMAKASADLIALAKRRAAQTFDVATDQVRFEDGQLKITKSNQALTLWELARFT